MTPTRPTSGDIPLPAEPLGGVVFDMDGLMFNTEGIYQEVGRRVLARFGKDFPEALIDQIMGLKTEQALGVMIQWHRLDVSLDEFAELSYRCFQSLLPQRLEPMPGLLPLLSDLERIGVPKAIATSSQRRTADDVLARFNLHARFAAILTSEDVEQGKPAPEIYQRAAAALGCRPAETLALEDSELGCQAAVAAGAYTVAVPHGHSRRYAFTGAKFIATTLADPRIGQLLGF